MRPYDYPEVVINAFRKLMREQSTPDACIELWKSAKEHTPSGEPSYLERFFSGESVDGTPPIQLSELLDLFERAKKLNYTELTGFIINHYKSDLFRAYCSGEKLIINQTTYQSPDVLMPSKNLPHFGCSIEDEDEAKAEAHNPKRRRANPGKSTIDEILNSLDELAEKLHNPPNKVTVSQYYRKFNQHREVLASLEPLNPRHITLTEHFTKFATLRLLPLITLIWGNQQHIRNNHTLKHRLCTSNASKAEIDTIKADVLEKFRTITSAQLVDATKLMWNLDGNADFLSGKPITIDHPNTRTEITAQLSGDETVFVIRRMLLIIRSAKQGTPPLVTQLLDNVELHLVEQAKKEELKNSSTKLAVHRLKILEDYILKRQQKQPPKSPLPTFSVLTTTPPPNQHIQAGTPSGPKL